MNRLSNVLITTFAIAAPGLAQSTIFGVDLRQNETFTSDTADFVANYTRLASESRDLYGIDFDSGAQTLYGIDNVTLEIVTIDLATGIAAPTGTVATLPGLSGLTASPDGTTWYVSEYDGADTLLFSGSIITGVFSLVGIIDSGIIIDIAMDSQGNLYGFSISNDSLYTIDTATGAGTVVGPVGLNGNFAQGMDFDWSTDTLYATIYTGSGTGKFCTIDLTTGLANQLEDTFALNAEMEMAVQFGLDAPLGMNYCVANMNSTGATGEISAFGSAAAADNTVALTASSLPPLSFGFFITSTTSAFVANPAGSAGNLCLGGQIGRYVGPGQIQQSDSAGSFSLTLDLTMTPQPNGFVAVMAGETWRYQAWHRDTSMTGPTSNFTNGLAITYL